jgi:hypothetical protein
MRSQFLKQERSDRTSEMSMPQSRKFTSFLD